MSGSRKTIRVDHVRDYINDRIALSVDDQTQARRALALVIEDILHETGNYHGFQYLKLPAHGADGTYNFDDPTFDGSRRRYL